MVWEIDGCFMGSVSTLRREDVCLAVNENDDVPIDRWAFKTSEVYDRRGLDWTNVGVVLFGDITLAQARMVHAALVRRTGHHWHPPTQDSYTLERETGGKTYGMFTSEGALKVKAAIEYLTGALRDGTLSPVKLEESVRANQTEIASAGHGEVWDTAVRETIWGELDRCLSELGITVN